MVDENQVEGRARDIGGKVQDAAGEMMGDVKTQAKGKMNEARGKAQSTFGDAAEELRGNVSGSPLTALAIVASAFFALGLLSRR